ncbi:MAG TPA: RNA polymerase sigma-70 factor [Puia sp.]|jgi:RNA polymerase sigma-70 factor (ECF subfamily)
MIESSHSDAELLKLLAAGDEAAFRTLFERYRDNLFIYISRFVKSDQVAEELVMDVFMKLWLGRDIVLRIEHFSAFLFRVARNKCIDFLRTAARDDDFRQLLWSRLQGVRGEQADSILLLQEYEATLREAIELLSPQRRKVYLMSREQEQTHDDIARQLKISRATVNNHIVDAQAFIRKYLIKNLDLAIFFLATGLVSGFFFFGQ